MNNESNDSEPVFDMYRLFSRWDVWLAVAFVLLILLGVLYFRFMAVPAA